MQILQKDKKLDVTGLDWYDISNAFIVRPGKFSFRLNRSRNLDWLYRLKDPLLVMVLLQVTQASADIAISVRWVDDAGEGILSSFIPRASFAIMTASGCPCLEMRATPFCFFGDRRPQLAPAVTLRFGALTPCYGHGLDHRRRQSHHRSGKRNNLNSQFRGQITSFRKRRHCQHTGLTPLTASHCITVTRTYVPYFGNSSVERRAA